jgi:hypothetical protein
MCQNRELKRANHERQELDNLNEEYKLSTHTILSENNNQSDIKNSNIIS